MAGVDWSIEYSWTECEQLSVALFHRRYASDTTSFMVYMMVYHGLPEHYDVSNGHVFTSSDTHYSFWIILHCGGGMLLLSVFSRMEIAMVKHNIG